jgi:hypothetical protein
MTSTTGRVSEGVFARHRPVPDVTCWKLPVCLYAPKPTLGCSKLNTGGRHVEAASVAGVPVCRGGATSSAGPPCGGLSLKRPSCGERICYRPQVAPGTPLETVDAVVAPADGNLPPRR